MRHAGNFMICALWLISATGCVKAGANDPYTKTTSVYFGRAFDGISPQDANSFDVGYQLFVRVWRTDEGLGPNANEPSCANCHAVPLPGGAGHKPVLPNGNVGHAVTKRVPPLFGLGLIDQIPDSILLSFADLDDRDGNGIRGIATITQYGIGRFGSKANVRRLSDFVGLALFRELGLTNTIVNASGDAPDLGQHELSALVTYLRLLAVPPTRSKGESERLGEIIFGRLKCAVCHRPNVKAVVRVKEHRKEVLFHPFTDLLLHDVMSDGEGDSSNELVRTAPLWGIASTGPPFMHDGGSWTIEDAVRRHSGEAKGSADGYASLTSEERRALIAFVRSL